jgi:hypothetical protein
MMTMSADIMSLVIVNSASALLLGLSGVLAYEVLPGRRRVSIVIHFIIMAAWAVAVIAVTVVHGDELALIERRWIGAAATLYVTCLIALHARRQRARREVR